MTDDPKLREQQLARWQVALLRWSLRNDSGGLIPAYMIPPVAGYLAFGEPVGHFLTSVIADLPLSEVAATADDNNGRALVSWHRLIYNIFPIGSHGSKENMATWQASGGLKGQLTPYAKLYFDEAVADQPSIATDFETAG